MSTGNGNQLIREERSYRLSKDWIRYRGPFGGEGWQHVETGEVRYVDEPPGDVAQDEQVQTTLPGEGFELNVDLSKPKWIDSVDALESAIADSISLEQAAFEMPVPAGNSDEPLFSNAGEVVREYWEQRNGIIGSEGEYEDSVDGFLNAAEDWIKEHGDEEMAGDLQERLQEYDSVSPWGETDAPDHLNPENAENITPLYDTQAKAGVSAGSMMVAEMDHGDRVFLTNVNIDAPGDIDAEGSWEALAAEQSATFLDELGISVPEHHYEEGEFLAVAEASGQSIDETMGRVRVSEGEFTSFAATQLLVGNTDAHSQNVFYGYDGLQVIDLDLAGKNFEEQPGEVAWGLGQLFDTGVEAGVYPPYSDDAKDEFVRNLRAEVQGWAESDSVEEALDAVENEEIREIFRTNIELARNGELLDEDQEVRSGL